MSDPFDHPEGNEPTKPPRAHPHPPMAKGVRWAVWRPLAVGAVIAATLWISAALLFSSMSAPTAAGRTWARDARDLWTPTESRKMAELTVFTTPFFSAGPPAFDTAPASGPGSHALSGSVREQFDKGHVALKALEDEWRSGGASSWLDPSSATGALADLERSEDRMGSFERRKESLAVNYHLALLRFWTGQPEEALRHLSQARTDPIDGVGQSACPTEVTDESQGRLAERPWPLGASARVRSGVAACLWLQGRAEADLKEYDKAAATLGRALTVAGGLRGQAPIVDGRPVEEAFGFLGGPQHLIRASMGDLWRDYLSAQIARSRPDPSPVPDVERLLRDGRGFQGRGDVVALARVWGLQQGRPDLVRAAHLPTAASVGLPSRDDAALSAVDQAALVLTADSHQLPAGLDRIDGMNEAAMRDWVIHACRRNARLAGETTQCGDASATFESWRRGSWKREFEASLRAADSVLAKVTDGLRVFATWLLAALGMVAFWVGGRISTYRRRRYREVFGSRHYADYLNNPKAKAP